LQHRLEQFEQRIAALETAVRGKKGDIQVTLPVSTVALMCALAGSLIMFCRRAATGRRSQRRSRWRERSRLERADAALGPYFWGLLALALAAALAFSIVMQMGTDEPFR
jgi:hypothetical protein